MWLLDYHSDTAKLAILIVLLLSGDGDVDVKQTMSMIFLSGTPTKIHAGRRVIWRNKSILYLSENCCPMRQKTIWCE